MKNNILVLTYAMAMIFATSSCGSGEQKKDENATETGTAAVAPAEITDMTGVTSYYECPMKCEGKKFAEAGACPVCGMDIVLVELQKDASEASPDTTKM